MFVVCLFTVANSARIRVRSSCRSDVLATSFKDFLCSERRQRPISRYADALVSHIRTNDVLTETLILSVGRQPYPPFLGKRHCRDIVLAWLARGNGIDARILHQV